MSDRVAVFNDGRIQQLAPPEDLYERPDNSFVAQFIGENNRLKGTVEELGKDNSCTVRLSSGDTVKASAIGVSKKGEQTLLSLRPERVQINPSNGSLSNVLDGRIEEIIYLGDHMRTRLSVAGHSDFIVKVPNRQRDCGFKQGEKVKIGWTVEDCRALDCTEPVH